MNTGCGDASTPPISIDSLLGLLTDVNKGWETSNDGAYSYGYDGGATSQSQEGGSWSKDPASEVRPYLASGAKSFPEQLRPLLQHDSSNALS